MTIKNDKKNRISLKYGFSLVEIIIYSALLGLFFAVMISSMVSMYSSYKVMKVSKDLSLSATSLIERIGNEIRRAESIKEPLNPLGVLNYLVLDMGEYDYVFSTPDTFHDPLCATAGYLYLSKGKGSQCIGNLTAGNVEVNSITFTRLSQTEGVKVDITMTAHSNGLSKSETFHNTIVVRKSLNN